MYYLENLASNHVRSGVLPWEFNPTKPIPGSVRADKGQRSEWITNSKTKHHVYSLYEGVNPHHRVTKGTDAVEGNPPVNMWGLVADYDNAKSESFVLEFARSLPVPPNWIERTLSLNWRYVWQFEEPARLPSYEFAKYFLKQFSSLAFSVETGMAGFDKAAFQDPARYFTNSCDWRRLSSTPIAREVVRGWLVKASQSFQWTTTEFGPVVPLDVAQSELQKKYPRFSEWPGEFTLNSQGPSFWVLDSISPKSAIVRETGIQTFAAHAHKAFFTWSDLLGHQFVNDYEAAAVGRAVEEIYFDGKHYFRQNADKNWRPFERHDIALHLRTERHVSPKTNKAGVSDVDRCLAYIQTNQSVNGAAPFAMTPAGLVRTDNALVLNTSTRRTMPPSDGPALWGANGQFVWMSKFLDVLFEPREQLDYFLSWLSYFYKSAWRQQPRSGQNIFLAGDTGVGKSLLGTKIISMLVGGSVDARDYLLGEDKFGSELFEVPLWCVDDATFTADQKTQKRFSEMIKAMAANKSFRYHAKFRVPLMVQWQGRVIVTCNRDEQSIMVLPDLERSILDKIMLFKTADTTVVFPEQDELEAILKRELPFFARYLLDYKIPPHCTGDARFGVKPYHEATLVETAKQSSRTAVFAEILGDWKRGYFSSHPDKMFWEGSAFQLHRAILEEDWATRDAMRGFTANSIRWALSGLKNKGMNIECRDEDEQRIWRINRPAAKPKEPANLKAA